MKSILALSFLVMCLVGVAISQTITCACTCNGSSKTESGPPDKCTCICGGASRRSVSNRGWTEPMGVKRYSGPLGFPGASGLRTYSESARPGSGQHQ